MADASAVELAPSDCLYQACYCEENVWHLARHRALASLERRAVFVTNARRTCPMWFQRAATAPGEPVVWDYHVVLWTGGSHARPRAWDLDSKVAFGAPLEHWLGATFLGVGGLPDALQPRFRIVGADDLLTHFASDRRHMRAPDGTWLQPPPPWPAIAAGHHTHTLERFLDLDDEDWPGEVLDLDEIARRVGDGARL